MLSNFSPSRRRVRLQPDLWDLASAGCVCAALLVTFFAATGATQSPLPSASTEQIDRAAADVLSRTGTPSASIAVVQNGQLVYAHAYGQARLDPPLPATSDMRYSIGSVSKQFTAAAILLLAEERKLSLNDRVGKWLPNLTRAGEVTIRQLLSMTAGYQDFWPQDYVMPGMLKDTTAKEILDGWARKPLDFDPGTRWQYSNTNYVIAGLIVERVAGKPLLAFLRDRVFTPLQMRSVADTDSAALGAADPMRYMRLALAPPRPAPKEGRGWMFAAGELAMTASDLARWDISMIKRSVLRAESYRELETEVLLANGAPTGYGLGVNVGTVGGRRRISHTGEVSGFTARNDVYPDDGTAIAVLTNLDATSASSDIASRIASTLLAAAGDESAQAVDQARRIFEALQQGRIDRSQFTDNLNAYFSVEAIHDFQSSLAPLGNPDSFSQTSRSLRGGMVFRRFEITFPMKTLVLTTFTMPDGKLEQYLVAASE
jgi:CubicO group peptidase (beta-lactamase class C family)